jgi:hypothetical protein
LNASKDPIHGNDKKGDTFWKEVTKTFNQKGEGKHIRELNQLKIHWCRLKESIGEFNDYWTKVCQIHTSGYSDDMLEKEAQEMYTNKFGKPFTLVHMIGHYTSTMTEKDTSTMTEAQKAAHDRALHKIEQKLFGN